MQDMMVPAPAPTPPYPPPHHPHHHSRLSYYNTNNEHNGYYSQYASTTSYAQQQNQQYHYQQQQQASNSSSAADVIGQTSSPQHHSMCNDSSHRSNDNNIDSSYNNRRNNNDNLQNGTTTMDTSYNSQTNSLCINSNNEVDVDNNDSAADLEYNGQSNYGFWYSGDYDNTYSSGSSPVPAPVVETPSREQQQQQQQQQDEQQQQSHQASQSYATQQQQQPSPTSYATQQQQPSPSYATQQQQQQNTSPQRQQGQHKRMNSSNSLLVEDAQDGTNEDTQAFDSVLDDLISLGESPIQSSRLLRSPAGSSSTPHHPQQQHPHHHPSSAVDAPSSLDSWRLTNAVHMELQENARLPTFYTAVDRTGSVTHVCPQTGRYNTTPPHRSTRHPPPTVRGVYYSSAPTSRRSSPNHCHSNNNHNSSDNIINSTNNYENHHASLAISPSHQQQQKQQPPPPPPPQQQQQQQAASTSSPPSRGGAGTQPAPYNSLAEKFLCSSHRRSYHATYEAAGVLKDDAVVTPFTSTTTDNHNNTSNSNTTNSIHVHKNGMYETKYGIPNEIPIAISNNNSTNDICYNNNSNNNNMTNNDVNNEDSAVAVDNTNDNDDCEVDPLDMLAAEVDPTPLSEIRRKVEAKSPPHTHAQNNTTNGMVHPVPPSTHIPHAMRPSYTFFPHYGGLPHSRQRPYPLPIPSTAPVVQFTSITHPHHPHNERATSHGSLHNERATSHGSLHNERATSHGSLHSNSSAGASPAAVLASADALATAAAIASQHAQAPTPPISMPQPGPYTTAQRQTNNNSSRAQQSTTYSSTAAAASKQQNNNNNSSKINSLSAVSASKQQNNNNSSKINSLSAASATTTTTAAMGHPNHHHHHHHIRQQYPHSQQRSQQSPPPSSGATSRGTPPEAIERASSQKAQYGFGKKHVVPSVPAPPNAGTAVSAAAGSRKIPSPITTSPSSSTSPKPPAAVVACAPAPAPSSQTVAMSVAATGGTLNNSMGLTFATANPTAGHGSLSASSSQADCNSPMYGTSANNKNNNDNNIHGNNGAAYERKKQRAKDARVKLNESIERLSISINMAGTQSKQRLTQWERHFSSRSPHRQTGLKIIQDCMQTAESAKKWDRPSFVGSAAVLIQGLNSQCDALMRELLVCHEQAKQQGTTTAGAGGVADVAMGMPGTETPICDEELGGGVSNEFDHRVSEKRQFDSDSAVDPAGGAEAACEVEPEIKRQKTDDLVAPDSILDALLPVGNAPADQEPGFIWSEHKISIRIASMLDTTSLVRCSQVSKSWRAIFARDDTWIERAIQRFGHYNARQWRGKFEDEDGQLACSPLRLYKSMDCANVMPHFNHEGMFLLGEARLPGKVSAWTFLVERSNGETLRTVKREPNKHGPGIYTSLPIIELKTVVQNTGVHDEAVILREQVQTVDASTRRRGEEMKEVTWDDRFKKRILDLDGTERPQIRTPSMDICGTLCSLKLFESVVIESYILARGCLTISKFVQRSNFTKVLVQIRDGTTVPLVIPFPRDALHHLEH